MSHSQDGIYYDTLEDILTGWPDQCGPPNGLQ